MTHQPYLDWMQAKLDDALDPEAARELDAHLAACAECVSEWLLLLEVHHLFQAEPPARPRPGFTGRFKARLEQRHSRPRLVWGALALGFGAVGAAALVLPVGIGLMLMAVQTVQEPAATAALWSSLSALSGFLTALADALFIIGGALLRTLLVNPLTGVVGFLGLVITAIWAYFIHNLGLVHR